MASRRIITILAILAVLALLAALVIWLVFPQWRNTTAVWLPFIAAAVLGGLGAIKLIADVSNGRAWYSRGVSRARLGDQAQAIADFTRALELDPNFVQAFYNRGLAYASLGEFT